jgi:hypothetical protein
MSDFSQEITNFQRYGSYTYNFDSVGNMTFNSSSVNFNQVYVAFPLQNVVYNNGKIATIYDVEFEEFIPTTSSLNATTQSVDALQQQVDVLQQENTALSSQLDSVISQNESSGSSASTILATMQVILELRKALGQGRVDSDFSTDFPYTPIVKSTT